MGRYTPLYSNFTSGELSPRTNGRSDQKFYYNGCKELTNMIVFPHGGITKRPGTYYVSTAAVPAKDVRLIPFRYSTTQAYIIELSDYIMRFYMEGGQILDGSSAYQISHPWAAADLDKLRFTQSADVMYIVHPDYAPRKLTRSEHTSWTLSTVSFENGPFLDKNTSSITVTPSAVSGTVTLTASSSIFDSTHEGAFWKLEGDLTKTATVSGTGGYTDAIQIDAGESVIAQINGTWGGSITLQRSLDEGSTWLDYNTYSANTSATWNESQDGTFYRMGADSGDITSGSASVSLSKQDEWGYVKITGYASGTVVTGTVQRTLVNTDATTDWYEGAWSDFNGYPETVAFYEQRLLFGGNFYRPQTIWGSKVDDYEDFDEGTGLDDEAYTFTLVSNDVNSIRWMVGADALRIGTVGGEWRFGVRDSATTPSNVSTRRFSTIGSAQVDAKLIGSSVMFIQYGGRKLRAMVYDLAQESYVAPEISIKAEHMMKDAGGVTEMAYTQQPDPTIWMVSASGTLIGCTYDQYNQISAFHEHETDGLFKSIAAIPSSSGDRDELWVVVSRTVSGTTTKHIEQLQTYEWSDQEDAIYMDDTITYDGISSTTISGLENLEGESVQIITDGSTHPNKTVVSGTITLSWSAEKVHVGRGYTSTMKTMPYKPPVEAGTAAGKRKNIFKLSVDFLETSYCKIGAENGTLDIIPFRSSADEMDQAVPLYTGTRTQAFPRGFQSDLVIHIESELPRPFTVLALAPTGYTSPA